MKPTLYLVTSEWSLGGVDDVTESFRDVMTPRDPLLILLGVPLAAQSASSSSSKLSM